MFYILEEGTELKDSLEMNKKIIKSNPIFWPRIFSTRRGKARMVSTSYVTISILFMTTMVSVWKLQTLFKFSTNMLSIPRMCSVTMRVWNHWHILLILYIFFIEVHHRILTSHRHANIRGIYSGGIKLLERKTVLSI